MSPNATIRALPVPFLVERAVVPRLAAMGIPMVDRDSAALHPGGARPWVQVEDPFYIRVVEVAWRTLGYGTEPCLDLLAWLIKPENEARLRLGASAQEMADQYLLGPRWANT